MDYEKEIERIKTRVNDVEKTLRIQGWAMFILSLSCLIKALEPVLKAIL